MTILETSTLGRRYGRDWALRDCTLTVPDGHLVALVGPNGAGKSTLLNIAVGLTIPSEGEVTVLDGVPVGSPAALNQVAFVAQDMPLYRTMTVDDMLHLTRNLNHAFDSTYARRRLEDLGIPRRRRIGKLSGGQRSQLALSLALARHPRLLILDEPTASLDPVARHDFMATVVTAMTDDGVSVILSSHGLAELERVADYLVLLTRGSVRIDGLVDDLLGQHLLVTGPAGAPPDPTWQVIESHHGRRSTDPARPRRLPRDRAACPLGGAAGRRRRARPGLPARIPAVHATRRSRRRPDDRIPAHGPRATDNLPARAVASARLGRLAALPHDAARHGRAHRRHRGRPARPRSPDARRLRGGASLHPAGIRGVSASRSPSSTTPTGTPARSALVFVWLPGRHRRVRRRSPDRPRAGDRHVPLRLDPRRRPHPLDPCPDRRRRPRRRSPLRRVRRCSSPGTSTRSSPPTSSNACTPASSPSQGSP